jgi:hypothetical protein
LNVYVRPLALISPLVTGTPITEIATVIASSIHHLVVAPATAANKEARVTSFSSRGDNSATGQRLIGDRLPVTASATGLPLRFSRDVFVVAWAIGRRQRYTADQTEADDDGHDACHDEQSHSLSFILDKFGSAHAHRRGSRGRCAPALANRNA